MKMMEFKSLFSRILFPMAGVVSISLTTVFSFPASAFNLNFNGGTCEFTDFSTGGLLLAKNCINNTNSQVDDIHLSVSYLDDDGNAIQSLNRNYDDSFSTINPRGTYTFPGLGWLVYNNSAIGNTGKIPDKDNLRLSGYWTKGGTPVPEPFTTVSSGVALGFGIILKKQHSKGQKKAKSLA